jgi:pimeloyl-ACP methyl ester carboxylesterase
VTGAAAIRETTCHEVAGDGVRLKVFEAGSGTPLVLVHGWAMDHRVFEPQIGALAGQFRVITFDRRGFGRTGGRPDLARETDDIDAIADALIDGPFHLLGLSQGGRVAARYAAMRPERLRSLILQGAAIDGVRAEGPAGERVPVDEYAALARQGRIDEVRRRWLAHPMTHIGEGHPEAERLLHRMLADYDGRDLVDYRPAAFDFDVDVPATLAAAGLPLLLLTGERETEARRRMAALLRERVPGAREVLLPASGHLGNLSEPEAYNEAVRRFCLAVDAGAGSSAGGAAD